MLQCLASGEILLIEGRWYITHSGLLRIARRCCGIHVEAIPELCDSHVSRFTFKATLYRSRAKDLSDMEMLIRLLCRISFPGLNCASPRRGS
jgi:hypothetical protein